MISRVQLQPAFVLHRRPYRESSLLLEVLSRDYGRVGLVARGARRGKSSAAATLQPFTALNLSWTARGDLGTLTGFECQAGGAVPSRRALYSGFYVNEVMLRVLVRHDPHPELFDSYGKIIQALAAYSSEDGARAIEECLRFFEKRVLEAVGYAVVFFDERGDHIHFEGAERYLYRREVGPRPHLGESVSGASDGLVVHGETLRRLDEETTLDKRSLDEAKRLMRYLMAPILGEKPLASRALFGTRSAGL